MFAVDGSTIRTVEEWPNEGCQLEWTEVTAADRTWFTIGFESFGSEDRLRQILQVTAQEFLPRLAFDLDLIEENSYSYPEWLLRMEV